MSNNRYIKEKQTIPTEYEPTENINFCSNSIRNYRYLVKDNNFIPILIGKGDIPRIWLYTKFARGSFFELVEDSVSTTNQIKIDILNSQKKIEIKEITSGKIILNLDYGNTEMWKINKLNLEPIGYKIIGTEEKLVLGSTTISGNTFDGVHTIIAFDSEQVNMPEHSI